MDRRAIFVPLIIIANVLIFLAWTFHYKPIDYMAENFLVSWSGLVEGRYWTLVTSVFSHNMFWHLFINMYVLSGFGSFIERVLGARRFLTFYFLAGVVSSLAHSAVSAFILDQPDLPALGASGAIAGVILLFSMMFPKEKILLFGIIPVPAMIGAFAFVGLDVWGLVAQARGGGLPIGHGAHIGGALTGVFYYYWAIRPKISRYR